MGTSLCHLQLAVVTAYSSLSSSARLCRKHERGDQHAEPAENKRGAGLILFGTGAVFGATDVGVTVAAKALGSTAAAGPLLGFWALGCCLAGSPRRDWAATPSAGTA